MDLSSVVQVWAGGSSLRVAQEDLPPDISPQFWQAASSLWILWYPTPQCSLSLHVYVCIQNSPLHKDTGNTGVLLSFQLVTSATILLPDKVSFWSSRGETDYHHRSWTKQTSWFGASWRSLDFYILFLGWGQLLSRFTVCHCLLKWRC